MVKEVDIRILASPRTAALTPDGKRFVFARDALWTTDLAGGSVHMLRKHCGYNVGHVHVTPRGNVIAMTSKVIRTWRLRTNKVASEHALSFVGFHALRSVSLDGTRALTSRANKAFSVWDQRRKKEIASYVDKKSVVFGAVLSADGRTLVHGGPDGVVRFFDVERAEHTSRVLGKGWIQVVARADQAPLFATAGRAGTVLVWHSDGTKHRALHGLRGSISELALSPDGSLAVACGGRTTPLVWDVESANVVAKLEGYTTGFEVGVCSVRFSLDGRRIVTVGNDSRVCVWRL